jgi:hypothetical protein
VHLARAGNRGGGLGTVTTLASLGAAVVAAMAAASLLASLDDLLRHPARFGAPWDLSIGVANTGPEGAADALAEPSVRPSLARAAAITGTDVQIGDEVAWAHAFVPVDGLADVLPPPISAGRAPATSREIAPGAITMRSQGLRVGDIVLVSMMTSGERFEMTVVGTAVINDTFEPSPGRGAVVRPEFIADAAPEVAADPIVVQLVDGADVQAVTRRLQAAHNGPVRGPVQQAAVRNVARIRDLPVTTAAVVAVLAAGSLLHLLVLTTNRHRRTVGVLKSLGFTRWQTASAIGWYASIYALGALFVAVPLGLIVGRLGWPLVARGLGVPLVHAWPIGTAALVVVGTLALAILAATYPALRAARLPTASALRAE